MEAITREEKIMSGENLTPITRKEMFLAKAAGMGVETPDPITREEMFLSKISGGGAVSSCKLPQVIDETATEITAEDLMGATKIRERAFAYWESPFEITLPNTITAIENNAFSYCKGITKIIIPRSVVTMGNSAFEYSGLEEVVIEDGLTELSKYAFTGCDQLQKIILPNTLETIFSSPFSSCAKLNRLTIPANVTAIGNHVFKFGSPTNKTTITFLGTTPPSITTSSFYADYTEKIIVPKGCGDTYKSATNWSNFAEFIEEAAE